MKLDLQLARPLAVFDIEATGTSPQSDRIIDLAIAKLMPDGSQIGCRFLLNPQIPIPPEATAIHGISDAHVAACPPFARKADEIYRSLEGCDLAGYNIVRFDIPMLVEEFLRANMKFSVEGRRVVDAQRIFHRREPRDLKAALAFYCAEMHLDAHRAASDVDATIRVLAGQLARYADLPRTVDELDAYCNPRDPAWVDRTGRLRWINGEITVNFGRQKGTRLRDLVAADPGFIKWILRSDFPRDMKDVVQNAAAGQWPRPPSPGPVATPPDPAGPGREGEAEPDQP